MRKPPDLARGIAALKAKRLSDLAALRAKQIKRQEARARSTGFGNHVPEPLARKRDESDVLARRAKEAHQRRLAQAVADYKSLRVFLKTLAKYAPDCGSPYPGVLDLDLSQLATDVGLRSLPYEVKFLAVQEVHGIIKRVNKRVHGQRHDALPWDLPRGVQYSLEEFRDTIGMR